MLLQDHGIGELLLADGAGVLHAQRGLCAVDPEVRLQVAFGGEGAATDLALEGPLPRVRPVMHLQGALAAQHPVADDTLVWVGHLLINVLYQLLQF
jgi:hypothetical protein